MSRLFAKYIISPSVFLIFSMSLYAQVDVTQFLGIPVDGYRPDMVNKLKSKGFTINQFNSEILDGEFNGRNVNVFIVTNNNKVWRIVVADANDQNEGDIRIQFNNLIKQFSANKNYISQSDSILKAYTIPESEDISYEMAIKNKRYQAVFYQKSLMYDSLKKEADILLAKKKRGEEEEQRLDDLIVRKFSETIKCFDKQVWFAIMQRSGKYYLTLFYDNVHNKANGEDL